MPLNSSIVEDLYLHNVSEKLLSQLLQPGFMVPTPSFSSSSSSSAPTSPLSKLRLLHVADIEDLVSLPQELFQNLISLRSLKIRDCNTLCSLSGALRHLTALQRLEIDDCRELDLLSVGSDEDNNDSAAQFQGLESLTSLYLERIPKLVSLPLGIQHLTELQTMHIRDCDNLMGLAEWIGKLKSLRRLYIIHCPQVTSLPETMKHLTALRKLRIWGCPSLEERSRPETGEDWPKIAHIPDFAIEDELW